MNTEKMKLALDGLNINPASYGIKRKPLYLDGYVIDEYVGKWNIYYYERGIESNIKSFDNEEDACQYFILLLKNDETTKINPTNTPNTPPNILGQ